MTDRAPSLDDLIGDLGPDERNRLEAVHSLLLEAGPPPELPPALREAPDPEKTNVLPFTRRYRFTTIAAAATIAVALFGAGYLVGERGDPAGALRTIEMRGAAGARASLALFANDDAGNWPMRLTVSGLPPLAKGETYELWLTKDGKLAEPCGLFTVTGDTTTVPLNAPYRLTAFDGWVVVQAGTSRPVLTTT